MLGCVHQQVARSVHLRLDLQSLELIDLGAGVEDLSQSFPTSRPNVLDQVETGCCKSVFLRYDFIDESHHHQHCLSVVARVMIGIMFHNRR